MGAIRGIFETINPEEEKAAEKLYEMLQELGDSWQTPFILSLLSGLIFVVSPFLHVILFVEPLQPLRLVMMPAAIFLFSTFIVGILLGGSASWFFWFRRRYKQRVDALKIFLQDPLVQEVVVRFLGIGTERIEKAESQLQRFLGLHNYLCRPGPFMKHQFRKLLL